jgi:hypothetical protein
VAQRPWLRPPPSLRLGRRRAAPGRLDRRLRPTDAEGVAPALREGGVKCLAISVGMLDHDWNRRSVRCSPPSKPSVRRFQAEPGPGGVGRGGRPGRQRRPGDTDPHRVQPRPTAPNRAQPRPTRARRGVLGPGRSKRGESVVPGTLRKKQDVHGLSGTPRCPLRQPGRSDEMPPIPLR